MDQRVIDQVYRELKTIERGVPEAVIIRMLVKVYKVDGETADRIAKLYSTGVILKDEIAECFKAVKGEKPKKIVLIKKEKKSIEESPKKIEEDIQDNKESEVNLYRKHSFEEELMNNNDRQENIDLIIKKLCLKGLTVPEWRVVAMQNGFKPEMDLTGDLAEKLIRMRKIAQKAKKSEDTYIPDNDMIQVLDYVLSKDPLPLKATKKYVKEVWLQKGYIDPETRVENKNGKLSKMKKQKFEDKNVCSLVFVIESLRREKFAINFQPHDDSPYRMSDIDEYKIYQKTFERKLNSLVAVANKQIELEEQER